jgi:hypothetical protein
VAGRRSGGVAQLGERLNGIQEVRGSIPLASMTAAISYQPSADSGQLIAAVIAGIAQLVEHNLAKVGVAGSSPVSRSEKQLSAVSFPLSAINLDAAAGGERGLSFSGAVSSVG